jgi:hypothetical protein
LWGHVAERRGLLRYADANHKAWGMNGMASRNPYTPAYLRGRKTWSACKKAVSAVSMRLGRVSDG